MDEPTSVFDDPPSPVDGSSPEGDSVSGAEGGSAWEASARETAETLGDVGLDAAGGRAALSKDVGKAFGQIAKKPIKQGVTDASHALTGAAKNIASGVAGKFGSTLKKLFGDHGGGGSHAGLCHKRSLDKRACSSGSDGNSNKGTSDRNSIVNAAAGAGAGAAVGVVTGAAANAAANIASGADPESKKDSATATSSLDNSAKPSTTNSQSETSNRVSTSKDTFATFTTLTTPHPCYLKAIPPPVFL